MSITLPLIIWVIYRLQCKICDTRQVREPCSKCVDHVHNAWWAASVMRACCACAALPSWEPGEGRRLQEVEVCCGGTISHCHTSGDLFNSSGDLFDPPGDLSDLSSDLSDLPAELSDLPVDLFDPPVDLSDLPGDLSYLPDDLCSFRSWALLVASVSNWCDARAWHHRAENELK